MNKIGKNIDFRKELLRNDIVPLELNEVSKKYKNLLIKELNDGKIKTEKVTVCQCGSNKLEQLTKIDRFGLPFESLICQDCGLVITSPRIQQESLPYYYEKFYHPLNYGKESMSTQEALFKTGQGKKIFNRIKEYLPKKDELTILEIGAGTGSVLKEFKEEAGFHGYKIDETGTEYNQDCILSCKRNGVNIIYGDLNTFSNTDIQFDVIILSHVFEHFIDLSKELEKIKNLLSTDGLLYVEVPGIFVNHKKAYYNFSFLGYVIHAHMYNFTLNSLINIVSAHGFSALYGNEEIEVVFKKGNNNHIQKNAYRDILYYLDFLFQNYDYFQKELLKDNKNKLMISNRDKGIAHLKETLHQQKKLISNRDEGIAHLKESIKNRNDKIENLKRTLLDKELIIDKAHQLLNSKIALLKILLTRKKK